MMYFVKKINNECPNTNKTDEGWKILITEAKDYKEALCNDLICTINLYSICARNGINKNILIFATVIDAEINIICKLQLNKKDADRIKNVLQSMVVQPFRIK